MKAFGRRDREVVRDAPGRQGGAGAAKKAGPKRPRNPARGLHGSIDSPREEITAPGSVTVGGWVFHETQRVRHVVVTFDDRPVALAPVSEVRADVMELNPDHPSSALSGWTVEVVVREPLGAQVRVGAHALLDVAAGAGAGPEAGPGGGRRRLGTPVQFSESTVPTTRSPAELGALRTLEQVSPGYVEVSGTARHPAGLARVEVVVDGAAPVLARHSLPGRVEGADDVEADLAGFNAFVQVPDDVDSVRLEVTVTGVDGTRRDLLPLDVPVVAPAPATSFTAARAEALAQRLARQVEALGRDAASSPPRVLVATHDLGLGGAQLYLDLLVRGLRERGVEMCLVSGTGGPLLDDLERDLGVPVLVVGQPAPERERLEAQRLQVAAFAAEHHVVAGLANTLLAFPAVSALQELGLPTTWAIHESFVPASFWRQFFGFPLPDDVADLALDALRRCDDVVFVAEATRALYAPLLTEGHSSVVPYGVDTAAVEDLLATRSQADVRAALDLPADARVLVCVGTVEPRKGQLALVRAFARLPRDVRDGAVLAVVGAKQDPYSAALREHVEEAGLDDVRVVDFGPDVLPWYLAADALVSASDIESLPRTMLEAMAVGRPVAATDVFGVGEVVLDGETGFTCEPLDLAALTAMLERVLRAEPAELERMGLAARALVAERHDPEGYVAHYADRLIRWSTDGER